MRSVRIIDAPTSAGAYAPGQEDGPAALHAAGLRERLAAAGVTVTASAAVPGFRWAPDPGNPRAANAAAVAERAAAVAALVADAAPGETVLVLGGDCTAGVGTVAGLVRRGADLGLIYLDRHADLNVPASTDEGALDWMGVAHMLDVDGAVDALARLAGVRPMLTAERLAYLGLGPVTPFEDALIAERGPAVVGLPALIDDPAAAAAAALAALDGCGELAVHFDVDVVDFLDAPLAENTNRGPAPSLQATGDALAALLADPRVRTLTVTELNPHHGAADGSTVARLADVLARALSA